ncbi:MAG TPA: hypothetical protein P5307_07940 [Pirellulaceae bacterium]|nr:hypothetical protein [Planctomycetales bacterium]MCB9941002.1 hypothetical protein [Planctomycetaceae bacterium]HRX78979.1 hypothetical protein [Pirellulaceae bacterium]
MMSRLALAAVLLLTTLPCPSGAVEHVGKPHSEVPMVRDVTLDERGILKGRTSPDATIRFSREGHEQVLRSGPDGQFAAQILPGVYVVQVGDMSLVCRVWSNKTSPPCATEELVLQTTVVRGQNVRGHDHDILWCLDRWTIPAIIVAGVGAAIWAAADGNSAS